MSDASTGAVVDPVTFEILRNAFNAICNEMSLVVVKTAYSTVVNEGHDFSASLYDRHGKLVTQGEFDLPAFVGITQLTVPEVVRAIGIENMKDGDIYLINDPYVASTHCNDVHLVKPLFYEGGLVGFATSTAHWSDVGGILPGSLNSRARTHFEEGIRIPALRIFRQGVLNRDVLQILLANMREGWERNGDLNAQVAAVNVGEARVRAAIEKHGLEQVLQSMGEVQNHSERLARAAWSAIPDGTYEGEDRIDMDVYTGEPVAIRLKLTIEGDHATFDFRESDSAAQAAINCTIAATTSGIFIATASILPPMPMNAGVMRTIEIVANRGSIVWAQPPVAVSGLAATSMEMVISATMQALTKASPERGVAVPYSILNTIFAGSDRRAGFEADFINYVWSFGGWGATKYADGPNAVASAYSGGTQSIPCEIQERRYPMLWRRYQLGQDSGGAGRTRGGLALDQLMEFPYTPGTLSCIGDREVFGPPGAFGGGPGALAGLVVNKGLEQERNIGIFCSGAPIEPGENVSFWSAGGGGYGDPLERPADAVVEDIRDEYLSPAAARSQYGVVVREIDPRRLAYEVDRTATESLREKMRAAR
ncbi:MAG: hydantoinase B/oxoprolinase family protein [Chloroflexi bacterium]|nr:hydantoinase B/oxoprolinase family protein [Chloroflexota bacterium]